MAFQQLMNIGLPDSLATLIIAWHEGAHYRHFHFDAWHTTPTGRGLRQGC